jgi:hypothetical protein
MRRTAPLQLLPLVLCLLVIAALYPWRPARAGCGDPLPQSHFYAVSIVVHAVCFVFLLVTLFKVAAARHSLAGKPGRPGWPLVLSLFCFGWLGIAVLTSPGPESFGDLMLAIGAGAVLVVALVLGFPAAIVLAILAGRALAFPDEPGNESLLTWQGVYLVLLSLAVFVFLPASAIALDIRGPLFCM